MSGLSSIQDGRDMIFQCDSGSLPCPQNANPWAVPDGPLIHFYYDTVHFKAALQICCVLLPQQMRDWEHSHRPLIEYHDTSRLPLLLHSVRTDLCLLLPCRGMYLSSDALQLRVAEDNGWGI